MLLNCVCLWGRPLMFQLNIFRLQIAKWLPLSTQIKCDLRSIENIMRLSADSFHSFIHLFGIIIETCSPLRQSGADSVLYPNRCILEIGISLMWTSFNDTEPLTIKYLNCIISKWQSIKYRARSSFIPFHVGDQNLHGAAAHHLMCVQKFVFNANPQ